MRIEFRVLRNDFLAKIPVVRNAAGRGTLRSAERVVAAAKARAKVDTGYMRDATRARRIGPTEAVAEATAPYSGYLDMGTRYIAADRWFTGPALAESGRFGAEMAGEVRSALGG